MTGKCDKEPDCKFGHRRVHDKRVGFKGVGVSMMNFLTNVTNDARQESGAGPVVEVPVGTFMRFPFASHFCFAQAQSLIEEQLRRMSDREEQLRNRLETELAFLSWNWDQI